MPDKKIEIPELEIQVSKNWLRLIRYCQVELPHGEIKIRIVNGQPTDLIEEKRKRRFDREQNFDEE